MKRKNRKLGAALALVLLSGIASVASTFAWWNTLKQSKPIEIIVGKRITLAVSPHGDLIGTGQLVPSDVGLLAHQVHSVTTKFELSVKGDVHFDLLQLKVTDEGRTFNGDAESEYTDFFVVKVEETEVNATSSYVQDVTSTIEVGIEFSIVVPEGSRNETTATALEAGIFKITLGFEILDK